MAHICISIFLDSGLATSHLLNRWWLSNKRRLWFSENWCFAFTPIPKVGNRRLDNLMIPSVYGVTRGVGGGDMDGRLVVKIWNILKQAHNDHCMNFDLCNDPPLSPAIHPFISATDQNQCIVDSFMRLSVLRIQQISGKRFCLQSKSMSANFPMGVHRRLGNISG